MAGITSTADFVRTVIQLLQQLPIPLPAQDKTLDYFADFGLKSCHSPDAVVRESGFALYYQLAIRYPPARCQEMLNAIDWPTVLLNCSLPASSMTSPSNDITPSLSIGSTPDASPPIQTPPFVSLPLSEPAPACAPSSRHLQHSHSGATVAPEGNASTSEHSVTSTDESRRLDHEDIRITTKDGSVRCRWGDCDDVVKCSDLRKHIAGDPKNPDQYPGKHLSNLAGKERIRCLWKGCTNDKPMLPSSIPRHIMDQDLGVGCRFECMWCGENRRIDAYKKVHGPARYCTRRPKDADTMPPSSSHPTAPTAHTFPSAGGPTRQKTTRSHRKKVQKNVAYPSPEDTSIPRHGGLVGQRFSLPQRWGQPIAGPSSSATSVPAYVPPGPAEVPFLAPQHSARPGLPFAQGSPADLYAAALIPSYMPFIPSAPGMHNHASDSRGAEPEEQLSQPQPSDFPIAGPPSSLRNTHAPIPVRQARLPPYAPLQPTSVSRQGTWAGPSYFDHAEPPFTPTANCMPYVPNMHKHHPGSYAKQPADGTENNPPYFGAP